MTVVLVPPPGGQGPRPPKGRHSPALSLSDAEALRVRNVIRGMRSPLGSLARVADATGLRPNMIKSVLRREVPRLARRRARRRPSPAHPGGARAVRQARSGWQVRRLREMRVSRPARHRPVKVKLAAEVKSAVGRAIFRGTDLIVGFLRQRGVPIGVAQDAALESAFITYRSIVTGSLAVPVEAAERDRKLAAYMRTAAWRLLRNAKLAGDIFMRHELVPGMEALESRTYEIGPRWNCLRACGDARW